MVTEMTKYDFILMSGDADAFLEKLQSVGVVDITRSLKPVDDKSEKLSARAEVYRKALSQLKGVEKAADPGEKPTDFAVEVMETVRDRETLQARLSQLYKDVEELRPWGQFDAKSFDRLKEKGLKLHFYKAKTIEPDWKEQYALSEISKVEGYSYFVVISDSDEYDFPLKELPVPESDYAALEKEIAEVEAAVKQKGHRLAQLKWHEPVLQGELDKTLSKLDLHLAHASGEKAAEDYLTVFEGFAPVVNVPALRDMLEKEHVFYLEDKAKTEDNPPIKLKNNKFVSMFEMLTDMYGRPKYDEFDPTVFISIFFMLFFAFCMGDCGYGLVLLAAGLLLKKVDSFKDMAPLVVILGVATMVIGFLFHTFFSMDISQWQVFAPIKGIFLPAQIAGNDATMVLALVVGILHICLAMVVKTIHQTRTKGFFASLGTWGWTLLIVGGVTVAAFALAGVLDANLTKLIVIVLGVVSALGIFVFNDPKRNKLANIGMGLWDTYNMITGLMGDVLSYLRLYALGLAGSMLGMAFNDMGLMVLGDGSNAILWLPFILLVVIGHTLNIAMCALGAFVHPLRLNFLEFFKNSGYEASGRTYNPLKK